MNTTCLSVLLVLVAAQSEPQDELMLPAPADWRFERIDFPLPFAPELKYEGFEELRFSPGMFNPESDTYFTYVFAMKIATDVALDAAQLQTLLETYFRGLCRTVAKEKSFDIDVSKITAKVHGGRSDGQPGTHFQASVESFDPFVTGKPLKLNLDMIVLDLGPADHRVFAAVSPQPAEASIWTTLRSLKDEFLKRFRRTNTK